MLVEEHSAILAPWMIFDQMRLRMMDDLGDVVDGKENHGSKGKLGWWIIF